VALVAGETLPVRCWYHGINQDIRATRAYGITCVSSPRDWAILAAMSRKGTLLLLESRRSVYERSLNSLPQAAVS
jgi:hypothetical protein